MFTQFVYSTWYSVNAKLSFEELQELQDLLRIRIHAAVFLSADPDPVF